MDTLSQTLATFVPHPSDSAPHAKGVCYFCISNPAIVAIWGAIDTVKQGQKCKKRIVVRPSRHYPGLHELYTYHFPKQWSKACQANRELIKTAQRLAHAIEKDHSYAALEWRIRHIQYLLNPVPGQKSYAHFYPFVYVTIYQSLRAASQSTQPTASQVAKPAASQAAQHIASLSSSPAPSENLESISAQHIVPLSTHAAPHIVPLFAPPVPEDVSFVPISPHICSLHRSFSWCKWGEE